MTLLAMLWRLEPECQTWLSTDWGRCVEGGWYWVHYAVSLPI